MALKPRPYSILFLPEALRHAVAVSTSTERVQPLGAQITTTLVATGMAAATRRQRGGGRVTGAFGGAADARRAGEGDVSELPIAGRVGRELLGAGFDGLWYAQR